MSAQHENAWGRQPGYTVKPWDDGQKRRLRLLVHEGLSDEEIAADLGRTVRAVAIKRAKLGMVTRRLTRRASQGGPP